MNEDTIKVKRLKIDLSQHIGAPAVAVVKKGDTVKAGQVIAAAKENALSVSIHAPIDGKVYEVTDKRITINA